MSSVLHQKKALTFSPTTVHSPTILFALLLWPMPFSTARAIRTPSWSGASAIPTRSGGYGARFYDWIFSDDHAPNNSCGNGSAMRVSSIGWLFDEWEDVVEEARKSAAVSHNHPEGIKGAECVAEVICWLRHMRFSKNDVERKVQKFYGYKLPPLSDIMRIGSEGHFDSTCQETVPAAIRCLVDSSTFEDAIRLAVLCDGDTDTKANITGAMAEACYGVPDEMVERAVSYLPADMRKILCQFYQHIQDEIG